MKKYLFFFICLMIMTGCSQNIQSHSERIKTPLNQSWKLFPSIITNFEVIEKPLRPDQMKWNLHVKFGNPETHVKVVLETSGVIQSSEEGNKALEWTEVQEGETATVTIAVKAKEFGQGSMKVKVEAYDQDGKFKYSLNPTQYFLVTKEEVLTGNNGVTELELQHIDHLNQKGKISDKDTKPEKKN
ncbi:hypothetical protein [Rossellomorea sp. y25]|uniref:hypothetical protein n=1 Tax=Rossellomorea sp. y25 TaxID=3118174 RepID=UPI0030DF0755